VFLCFLVDEEHNKKAGQPMFASEELQAVVHAHSHHSEKIAAQEQAARNRRAGAQGIVAADGNSTGKQ